ncbi:putative WD-repeat protein [Paraphaeosphaeria sporulosa]|uniref:Mitochondrial division protein 1 n=1 Tax=Paraphaeosphaeria sporulosa TaxID=1460663 RepID=A0A177CID6_9PLEO|nr:putative WD-repeat protein [Paraphaeosphaeria sporulosa]OAG06628.1 putative WD-repeat protein [Paraphaeosphaeria sporulosa]
MSGSRKPRPVSFTNEGGRIGAQIGQNNVNGDFIVQYDKDPLKQLPYAVEAPFNSYTKRHEPTCLPDTRVDLLHRIHSWVDGQDERTIFWLNGFAGTGKSTVARTVAEKQSQRGCLGASFFFSRGGGDVGHAGKFVASLACQLASNIPTLHQHICDAIRGYSDIASRSLREQWHQLVLRPLSKLDSPSCEKCYVLVVDALDECADEADIRIILHLLSEVRSLQRVRLRVFLTSRPEIPIRHGFCQIPDEHQYFILQNVSPSIIDHDITVFLKHNLKAIRQERSLAADWPGEDVVRKLVKIACGLFIWAATACRFIREGKRFAATRLNTILKRSGDTLTEPEKHLDEIYTTVLSQSVSSEYSDEEKEESFNMLRQILGSLVVLISPLSAHSLHKLLHVAKDDINQTLEDLHSVVDIPKDHMQPLRLHHPSFRDYLLSRDRCKDLSFWVDEMQAHRILVDSCLRLLSTYLKQDICELNAPGMLAAKVKSSRIEQFISPELQYACRYWVEHLQKSRAHLRDEDEIHVFLKEHLLHWLEVLGWMGKVSQGIHAVMVLESTAAKHECPRLSQYAQDARRFVLSSRQTIEQAPLQIYSSALVFAPTMSIIREQFRDCIPRWVQRLPRVQNNWSAVMQTLEGHSDSVSVIAFSRDGKLLASASCETVRVWDTATGALMKTFQCNSVHIRVIAFSPDGKLLASAQEDMAVKLWNTDTGAVLQTLKDHSSYVDAIAFSPDSKLLASASDDKTVKLWDTWSGALLQTLEGHSGSVMAVTFSLDGKLLASVDGETIKLWNTGTETVLQRHYNWGLVHTMAFSADGKLLIGKLDRKEVVLWDTSTGVLLQRLIGHSNSVSDVVVSPDGALLASASNDRTIKLWDAGTGAVLQTLEGHSRLVNAVAFSPDGRLLASASDDKTVKLWDIGMRAVWQTFEGHSHAVNTLAFSPDGKLLASASYDQTVKLWDVGTGVVLQTLADHSGSFTQSNIELRFALCVHIVVFSPNGRLLAIASNDSIIRLRDASSGVVLKTLEGHTGHIDTVAFSPNGKLLVSVSWKQTVLWDVATGAALQTREGYSGSFEAVAFSPDGKLLALPSIENTVKMWDVGTGALLRTLKGHSDSVRAIAFSPDGRLLASASWDRTIMLWGSAFGVVLQMFEVDAIIESLSFSYDGRFLETEVGLLPTLPASLAVGGIISLRNLPRGIFVKEQWVTRGTESLLWLPPEYRPSCTAFHRNVVALGLPAGRVVFMEFAR